MAYIPSSGSVVAFQGTVPFSVLGTTIGSVITVQQGSIAAVIVGGSVASAGVANQSVSGTVGASIIGLPPVNVTNTVTVVSSITGGIFPVSGSVSAVVTNFPTTQNVSGSVVATQGTTPWQVVSSLAGGIFPISGSVAATVTNTNLNVGGSVVAFQAGAWSASIMTNVITSIATAGQVMGSVAALQATNPWNIAGSVAAFITGTASVVTIQQGSIAAVQAGTWKPSIASNYTSNTASIISALGDLILGIRNDTMTSVMATGDGFYSPILIGPVGEQVVANAPIHKWVQGTTSVLNQFGTSMATIAAQGTSVFTYITGVQVVNMSANSVLVTFSGATSSVVGYTIAPPGGGSNIVLPNAWKTNANGAFTASVSGVSSVYVTAEGFISKT